MKDKVFCKDCIYHEVKCEHRNEWGDYDDVCTKDKIGIYDPVKGFVESTVRCKEKNEKMNCKDYETKQGFWHRR